MTIVAAKIGVFKVGSFNGISPVPVTGGGAVAQVDTTKFTDVALQDGSTGESLTVAPGGCLYACYDLGGSFSISGVSAVFTGTYTNPATQGSGFFISTDGVTWDAGVKPLSGFTPVVGGGTVTCRYVQMVFQGPTPSVTDARVFDAAGSAVLPPGSMVVSTNPPPRNSNIINRINGILGGGPLGTGGQPFPFSGGTIKGMVCTLTDHEINAFFSPTDANALVRPALSLLIGAKAAPPAVGATLVYNGRTYTVKIIAPISYTGTAIAYRVILA